MSSRIKISVLCHDMSHNCLGRAHILALALQRYYEVNIIGPASKDKVWPPLSHDKSVEYKILRSKNLYRNLQLIDGDVIYASKPKGTSLGYALLKKGLSKKPLILDIDDWDLGFFLDKGAIGKFKDIAHFWNSNNRFFTWLLEKIAIKIPTRTVSNQFLKDKFGGTLVPHFRDTDEFDPKKFISTNTKKKLGLKNEKVILFLGTPRKHKGIFNLITAVESLNRKDVILLIVGASRQDQRAIPRSKLVKVIGQQPFMEIPKMLAIADLVVIFQSDTKASQGQLPAKVFDAMSMAKPIIASRVSDLPKVLEGCGELVKPGDINGLAKKINYLLDNPKYAKELGRKARERCIKEYSYDAIAPKLHAVVEDVLAKARATAKT